MRLIRSVISNPGLHVGPARELLPDIALAVSTEGNGQPPELIVLAVQEPISGDVTMVVLTAEEKETLIRQLTGGIIVPNRAATS